MQYIRSAIRPVGWTLFLGVIYLLLAGHVEVWEIIAGLASGAIALVGVAAVMSTSRPSFESGARWLSQFRGVPAQIVHDCVIVLGALFVRIIHPRKRGVFYAKRFDTHSTVVKRAIIITSASLAPNTFVVGIDDANKVILFHQLVVKPNRFLQ